MLPLLCAGAAAAAAMLFTGCSKEEEFVSPPTYTPRPDSYLPPEKSRKSQRDIITYKSGQDLSPYDFSNLRFDRREKVDLEGDRKLGEVLFLRQFHRLHSSVQLTEAQTEALRKITGLYQLHILRELEEGKIKYVFVEDNPTLNSPGGKRLGDLYEADINQLRGIVDRFFPEQLSERFDKGQLHVATMYPHGDQLYFVRNPGVFLHPTLTPQELKNFDRIIAQGLEQAKDLEELIQKDPAIRKSLVEGREKVATREMINFLKKHPQERIAIIYGAAHDFSDDFLAQGFKPRLVSVWWDWPSSEKFFGKTVTEIAHDGFDYMEESGDAYEKSGQGVE